MTNINSLIKHKKVLNVKDEGNDLSMNFELYVADKDNEQLTCIGMFHSVAHAKQRFKKEKYYREGYCHGKIFNPLTGELVKLI